MKLKINQNFIKKSRTKIKKKEKKRNKNQS